MPRHPKAANRPQVPELWGAGVVQLRLWITPDDAPPTRPYVVMVLDLKHGMVVGSEMFDTAPTPADVHTTLLTAMAKPMPGTGRARRPERVLVGEATFVADLQPKLADISVACEYQDLPMLPEIARELELFSREGEPELPGLLSVKGVTPELAQGLFAAAAEFYRAEPWVKLTNGQTFALRIPAKGGAEWIASVMGNGGVEYGLAIYKSWAMFEKTFLGADSPMETLDPQGSLVLFYESVSALPFDDYDAITQHHWPVAAEQAYPMPMVFKPGDDDNVRRPDAAELRWLEAALRAVALLVRDHLRPAGQGDYLPLDVTLTLPTHAGEKQAQARYPGGQLPREAQPAQPEPWEAGFEDDAEADDEDDVPLIDRRMIEGTLSKLVGEMGAASGPTDPKLQKAQKLMYKAWEETNPAKRLTLAHKALATSPDCADAYVLLAEEEADTLARAVEMYRQGMEAGERALGPDYFKHEAGHFWGLLETRPYMRARAGLAHSLWELNRREEAVEHYQALLKLNEDDNQGARYSLLTLLLELDRDADLLKLLAQFKDDGMAEWLYTWALAEFRKNGAGKAADRRLKAALKQNQFVPPYLTGRKRVPNPMPPYMGWGDDDEAAHYAAHHLNHWRRTPGAVEWLKGKL